MTPQPSLNLPSSKPSQPATTSPSTPKSTKNHLSLRSRFRRAHQSRHSSMRPSSCWSWKMWGFWQIGRSLCSSCMLPGRVGGRSATCLVLRPNRKSWKQERSASSCWSNARRIWQPTRPPQFQQNPSGAKWSPSRSKTSNSHCPNSEAVFASQHDQYISYSYLPQPRSKTGRISIE